MRKLISIFLVLLLILLQLPTVGMADEDDFDKSKLMPVFSIENRDIPSGDADKTMTLSFNLKNTGYQAKNVVITPIFEGGSPFSVSELTNSQSIAQINSNSTVNVKIKLAISADAVAGNYPVKINIKYKNAYDYDGEFNETVYVRVTSRSTPPRLIINKVSTNPDEIGPGGEAKVSIIFENKGTIDARDLSVTLEGLKSDGGFYVQTGSNVSYINRVPGKSVSAANFNLKAANNIRLGSHELAVKFSYKDSQRNTIEDTQNIYLTIGGKSSNSSNIVIENMDYPTTGIKPNGDFTLKFDLLNSGEMDASNILVKLESTDPALVPKTTNIKKINSIKAGESESLSFIFTPTEEAQTRNYPINITVEYEDELNQGSEDKYVLTQYVGAYVNKAGEGDGKGKPKLIIDRYSFEPSIVKAGENYTMNLSFYNTNSQKTVRNIKIFLTADEKTDPTGASAGGNVFTPVGSSNTFYIDNIPPKGRVEKNITMFTVPDAQAKTYTVTANFEYEDNEGEEFTAIELIGVPVVQQSKLEVGELSLPPEAFAGEPTPVFVEFYNTGKVTLYNMMVKLEGDFQTENGSYYVGNFETGRSEYFEGMIIPTETGELTGALVFTYEDSSGENVEIRKDFTLNIMEPMPMDEFPEDMPPMEEPRGVKKIFKSKGFWITIILLAVAIGGFIFYKKRKKKGMALDE
ncbi:COG1361 S-layer family protein [Clostridium sp. Cult2]|uniref:COG1361 S-layer family protein n=1 Tax=Clostridium sp. Cult2 TaxID=2079003 RepID=UPI001F468A2D|nr:CARDB domain-containing protein [Clostridium sp. Cult2]MCF6465015.1 hypothetical protein [Clostridium sp. Cult2]